MVRHYSTVVCKFTKISVLDPKIFLSDPEPNPGSQLFTDPAQIRILPGHLGLWRDLTKVISILN
jgi:hypothetical protein